MSESAPEATAETSKLEQEKRVLLEKKKEKYALANKLYREQNKEKLKISKTENKKKKKAYMGEIAEKLIEEKNNGICSVSSECFDYFVKSALRNEKMQSA